METLTVKQAMVEQTIRTGDRKISVPFYYINKDAYSKSIVRVSKAEDGKLVKMTIETDTKGWMHIVFNASFEHLPVSLTEVSNDEFHTALDLAITAIENTLISIEKEG